MRLFVGAEIDRAVASAAANLIDELRRRAERHAPHARITWIPEERLHLTVRFIGNADDAAAAAIRSVLKPQLGVPSFPLTLAATGAFPSRGSPRVLWAGVAAGRGGLERVEAEVTRRLASVGVPPGDRPYNPHLTLARVREPAGLRTGPLVEGLRDRVLGTTRVEAITLFESRLSPNGPTYVPLQRTALQADS